MFSGFSTDCEPMVLPDWRRAVFDEPLSNLDAALRGQMCLEIRALQRQLSVTSIYVTHDQAEAMTMADRIVVLRDRRIEQVGATLELYHRPANRFVAGFIGSPAMNFLEGPKAVLFAATAIGVRPEHVTVSDNSRSWPGTVLAIEFLGNESHVQVALDCGGIIQMRTPGNATFAVGNPVTLQPDPAHVHRFDSDGRTLRT